MKAKELIEQLQELVEEHGNQPIRTDHFGADKEIFSVEWYDADGNQTKEAAEFYLLT